jgi:hypothetical protein
VFCERNIIYFCCFASHWKLLWNQMESSFLGNISHYSYFSYTFEATKFKLKISVLRHKSSTCIKNRFCPDCICTNLDEPCNVSNSNLPFYLSFRTGSNCSWLYPSVIKSISCQKKKLYIRKFNLVSTWSMALQTF